MKKVIALTLIVLMLFQGCVVYQKTSVSLDQAVDQGKVKVEINSGQFFIVKGIRMIDGTYCSVVKFVKQKDDFGIYQWVEITEPINDSQWEAIYLKDKRASKVRTTVLLSIGIPFAAISIFMLIALIDLFGI